jgi:SAM-dependent methyltransferase
MNTNDRKLLMSYIENIIPYTPVETMDEGIGTVYERRVIGAFLEQLAKRYGMTQVLEFPCDGITGLLGINSLIFSQSNCDITLCNPHPGLLSLSKKVWTKLGREQNADFVLTSEDAKLPFPDDSFDIVWNFCMFERYADPTALIEEMCRLSRKLVLVMTQNWRNWGTGPHRFYHRIKGYPWDHGYKKLMLMSGIKEFLGNRTDFQIVETGGIDIPPIIDTWDLPIRGTLTRILKAVGRDWRWTRDAKSEKSSRTLDIFASLEDGLPRWFKRYQAHHLYVLAAKQKQ